MRENSSSTRMAWIVVITTILVLVVPLAVPIINEVAAQEVPNGPWVDSIAFEKEPDYSKLISRMKAGEISLYLIDIPDPELLAEVAVSPELKTKTAYGLYFELTLNPVGPVFKNGAFNPFSNPKIREAMNCIVDRKYIVDEIMKGWAKEKYVSFISAFPEYGRLADVIKLIEAKYRYNFEKGREIIFEEMAKMGAEYKEGKWYYNGTQITIKMLIRTEDQRRQIGDYVADQLEKLGFATERMYRTSKEASPLWLFGDPADGQWHVYTGGWISTVIGRDDSDHFGFFYTPLGIPVPLWQAYKPDPIFYEIATKLWTADWTTWDERMELMRKAVPLALQDSVRVWLVDQIVPFVSRAEVEVAVDLSGGFNNPIWARTLKIKDQIGGNLKVANREVLVDPWNPIAGTNWVYDTVIQICLNDGDILYNPYTGLPMPNRFKDVKMEVEKDVRTSAVSPWVTLKFVDKVEVPTDAWFAWNATTKKLETAPAGTFAKAKVTVNYGNVIGKVKYHDGSTMTLADWFALWPLTFERVDPNSPLYDSSAVPGFNAWRRNFRGMKIISEDPLVVEYYINYTNPEAEFIAAWAATWPNTPWHMRALGIYAEEQGELAFSASKADNLEVEWMNYIGGPSLDVLSSDLDEMITNGYIPFTEHAGKYITTEEAKARYQKLKDWYNTHGHFWVASGPFYLDTVDFVGHSAVIKAFREYTYKADRWAWLAEPPVPESEIKVPDVVAPGIAANFQVALTYKGQPYPNDRIEFVKYLVLGPEGDVISSGEATPGAEGTWSISLPENVTAKMVPGAYTVMTIALSKDVAMPSIVEKPFPVIPQISYFQDLLETQRAELEASISTVETSLTQSISELKGTIAGLQSTVMASMGLAVVSLIVAVVAVVMARKKPA